jgi:hypothetical protein
MGQGGLPSTRARGPVRGSGVFESEVVVYGLAQFRLVTQRLADDRPVAGQRVLRLTQRRELANVGYDGYRKKTDPCSKPDPFQLFVQAGSPIHHDGHWHQC